MSDGMTIRLATRQDASGIAEVHVETWRTTYAGLVPDDYLIRMSQVRQEAVWQSAIERHGAGQVLVAALPEGGVVGFGNCGAARDRDVTFGGEIFTLYVAPDWQNQGIGRRLLAGLFRLLLRDGHRDGFLWVLSRNPTRFFYEAMGGVVAKERHERFAGAVLRETAYAWPDLEEWLGARPDLL